jgi:tetratricopeptide (TPR) repeat protein
MEKLYSQASAGRAGLLDRLNSYCSEQFPAHAGISELRTYMRVSALAKPDNDAATDVLLENFESFSDSYLSRSAKALLRVSLQKGATNNIARVCSRVYAEPEGIEKTARACAEPWLFVSKRNGDAAGIARKMKKLMSLDMESSFMYGLFRKYAYALMDMDDKKSISAGISVGNRILHRLDEPGKANRIKWALFDMNCYIERFPRAIEILDTIDDTSPEQIAMLKNKIAGHQAVAEGDWEEAVNSFRKFMDRIKEAEKDQFDPLSREVVPYEAVLGLNAKRIAGILEKHGQDSQARDAYREAKRYYGKALKSLTRQSPQRKRIKTVLAEIEEKLNQR